MVLAPQFDYLRALPVPTSVEEVSYEGILADRVARIRRALPDWVGAQDDPLYRVAQEDAYLIFVLVQHVNSRLRSAYRRYARDGDLDNIAAFAGLQRQQGETDAELNRRFETSLAGLSAGTFAGIEADVLSAGVGVDDIDVQLESTGQVATVYAAKDQAGLTAAEQRTLLAHITRPGRVHLGDTLQLGAVTTRAYTIAATISYDSTKTDVETLEALLRRAIYARIDDIARLTGPVTLFAIRSSMDVPGVVNVNLTTPSADAAGVNGEIPICEKTEAAVALTFTDVS